MQKLTDLQVFNARIALLPHLLGRVEYDEIDFVEDNEGGWVKVNGRIQRITERLSTQINLQTAKRYKPKFNLEDKAVETAKRLVVLCSND